MITASSAHSIALQVIVEPIEQKILTATIEGKFLVHILELHTEAAKYFRELGYAVDWEGSKSAFITWYKE